MTKKKKIIIISVLVVVLVVLAFVVYRYFVVSSYNLKMQRIEQAGFNNINGIVKSVEGNNLRILANVPESYDLLSGKAPNYIEKEFLLKTTSDSEIYLSEIKAEGEFLTKLDSIKNTKPNDIVSVIAKENILKNNELNVVELIIIKKQNEK